MGDSLPTNPSAISKVLAQYTGLSETGSAMRAKRPGLSGALVWRIERAAAGPLCLRRWPPEHPSAQRLSYIHAVLSHLADAGISFVPIPLRASQGATFVQGDGTLWEVTNWLAGEADYRAKPSPKRLAAAMRALADVHIRAATFAGTTPGPAVGISPGIVDRAGFLQTFVSGQVGEVECAINASDWHELVGRAGEILKLFRLHANRLERDLHAVSQLSVPLQPCIRDIHDEHVLFEGDVVTGIIDFGAMRYDNVAADVARLLGSMAGNDRELWRAGIAEYQTSRRLSDAELRLIEVFDRSATVLGSMQWLDWVFVEQREFSDRAVVLNRVDRLLSRLRAIEEPPSLMT